MSVHSTTLAEQLHERAVRRTGLTDFGGTDHHEPLEILLDAYKTDVRPRCAEMDIPFSTPTMP
jgi:hypothetical protein